MASNGTSCRMVPTGYSLSGTLSRKIRIASFNFSGSACLKRVFLILGQSRIHPKVCSETARSSADTLDTRQKPIPATRTLRLHTHGESAQERDEMTHVAYSFLGYDPPKRGGSRVDVEYEHGEQNRATSSSGRTCCLASAAKASSITAGKMWST